MDLKLLQAWEKRYDPDGALGLVAYAESNICWVEKAPHEWFSSNSRKQSITMTVALTVRCFIDFSSHWVAGAPKTPAFKWGCFALPDTPNGGLRAAIVKSVKFGRLGGKLHLHFFLVPPPL